MVLMLTTAAPVVWALHLFALYAVQALTCSHAQLLDEAMLPTASVILTVAAMLLLLSYAAWLVLQPSLPLRHVAAALVALSMLAVIWSAAPAVLLPACAPASA
jgi:hypothetical protein